MTPGSILGNRDLVYRYDEGSWPRRTVACRGRSTARDRSALDVILECAVIIDTTLGAVRVARDQAENHAT